MDMLRWLSFQEMMLNPYIKSFDKPRTPRQYCPFPWDQEEPEVEQTVVGLTEEEEQRLFDLMAAFDAKKQEHKSSLQSWER